jgi:hypothetical protein
LQKTEKVLVGPIIIGIFIFLVAWRAWLSSPKNIGEYGEKRVARKLHALPGEYITLNDILLPTHCGTTQIDHIVVSPYGIFVIETKNYKGWIFGHENSEEWKQSLLGKKNLLGWSSEQHKLRNPIRQNASHARNVRRMLKPLGEFAIIPIVVFSDNAELNITAPNRIVINWGSLRSTIRSYRTVCISQENIRKIVYTISSANITAEESRKIHVRNVQRARQKNEEAIASGRCPECGGILVERKGKYGYFLGCSNFPRCRFTRNMK